MGQAMMGFVEFLGSVGLVAAIMIFWVTGAFFLTHAFVNKSLPWHSRLVCVGLCLFLGLVGYGVVVAAS